MHFVISGTWGPTDPTRAMLPFIFAASAIQDNDTVTLMSASQNGRRRCVRGLASAICGRR
jgi:hypothetical protein